MSDNPSENIDRAEDLISKADSLSKEGKRKEAIQNLSKAISFNPTDPSIYMLRGVQYRELGESEKAIDDYSEAIKLDKEKHFSAFLYYCRGLTFERTYKYDKAISDYNCAIEIKSDDIRSYKGRAYCHRKLKHYEEAYKDCRKIIKLSPEDFFSRKERATVILLWLGSGGITGEADMEVAIKLAISDCDIAIKLNPNSGEIYCMRGTALKILSENDLAENDFMKAKNLGYEL